MSPIKLKASSKKELAGLYGIDPRTLEKWLVPFKEELGHKKGYFYTPKQMKLIFEKLGIPEVYSGGLN